MLQLRIRQRLDGRSSDLSAARTAEGLVDVGTWSFTGAGPTSPHQHGVRLRRLWRCRRRQRQPMAVRRRHDGAAHRLREGVFPPPLLVPLSVATGISSTRHFVVGRSVGRSVGGPRRWGPFCRIIHCVSRGLWFHTRARPSSAVGNLLMCDEEQQTASVVVRSALARVLNIHTDALEKKLSFYNVDSPVDVFCRLTLSCWHCKAYILEVFELVTL